MFQQHAKSDGVASVFQKTALPQPGTELPPAFMEGDPEEDYYNRIPEVKKIMERKRNGEISNKDAAKEIQKVAPTLKSDNGGPVDKLKKRVEKVKTDEDLDALGNEVDKDFEEFVKKYPTLKERTKQQGPVDPSTPFPKGLLPPKQKETLVQKPGYPGTYVSPTAPSSRITFDKPIEPKKKEPKNEEPKTKTKPSGKPVQKQRKDKDSGSWQQGPKGGYFKIGPGGQKIYKSSGLFETYAYLLGEKIASYSLYEDEDFGPSTETKFKIEDYEKAKNVASGLAQSSGKIIVIYGDDNLVYFRAWPNGDTNEYPEPEDESRMASRLTIKDMDGNVLRRGDKVTIHHPSKDYLEGVEARVDSIDSDGSTSVSFQEGHLDWEELPPEWLKKVGHLTMSSVDRKSDEIGVRVAEPRTVCSKCGVYVDLDEWEAHNTLCKECRASKKVAEMPDDFHKGEYVVLPDGQIGRVVKEPTFDPDDPAGDGWYTIRNEHGEDKVYDRNDLKKTGSVKQAEFEEGDAVKIHDDENIPAFMRGRMGVVDDQIPLEDGRITVRFHDGHTGTFRKDQLEQLTRTTDNREFSGFRDFEEGHGHY